LRGVERRERRERCERRERHERRERACMVASVGVRKRSDGKVLAQS